MLEAKAITQKRVEQILFFALIYTLAFAAAFQITA